IVPFALDWNIEIFSRFVYYCGKPRTWRMRKSDMDDNALAKERRNACLRTIVKLVRQHDIERPMFFLQGTHRARRNNPLHSQLLEAIHVGAEIHLRWHVRMVPVVSR